MNDVVAAVDCGSNTIKLFVGVPGDGAGRPRQTLVRESRTVRLGEGVDASGRLSDAALARAFAALDEYAALIAPHPVSRLRFCATAATRDADNAEEFAAGVEQRLGVRPEVISGVEEAALTFAGAAGNLRTPPALPVLVVDIGGGSTELVLGAMVSGRARIDASQSMQLGSVRHHERHLHSDPPAAGEIAACVAEIDATLDDCPVDVASAGTVVGVAGTILTVTCGVLDLPRYDATRTDQAVLPIAEVLSYVDRLVALPLAQRLALRYLHPGRADVVDAGALILSRLLRRVGVASMVASESDILDGIAASIG